MAYTIEVSAELAEAALVSSLARACRVLLVIDVEAKDHLHAGAIGVEVATRLPPIDVVVDDVLPGPLT